jgi:hypothetical protein
MRSDRPVIGSVVCLTTGISLIVAYCHDASSASIVYPLAGSTLHIDLTTSGPAVLGGIIFTAIGLLFLVWALLAAVVSLIARIFRHDEVESIIDRYRAPVFEADTYPEPIRLTERNHEG